MIMARFWLGLPADMLRFVWSVLAHSFVFVLRAGRKACTGLWWVAVPPGLDHCAFPTWHFISRVIVLSTLGEWFLHAPLTASMMAAKPGTGETTAWVLAWFVIAMGATVVTIGNLVLATCLRGTDAN